MQQKEGLDKLIRTYKKIQYLMHTIYILLEVEKRYKCVLTNKTVHTLVYKQTICGRGTKYQKANLIKISKL